VNSFVVSLLGLIPKANIGEPAVIMAVISIVAVVRLQRRLHTGRNRIVLAITSLAYTAQFGFGLLLQVDPHDSEQLINLSFIVFRQADCVAAARVVAAQGEAPGWRTRHSGDQGSRSAARGSRSAAGDRPGILLAASLAVKAAWAGGK